jgi:hypothetical protein
MYGVLHEHLEDQLEKQDFKNTGRRRRRRWDTSLCFNLI